MGIMRIVPATVLAITVAVCAYAAPTSGGKNDSSAVDDSNWRGGPTADWFVNWDKALAESKKTNKKLFLLSTGSDWCGWCKKLRAEVLDKPEFAEFARKNLVLVYLDSPSRDPLGKEQKAHNRQIVKALPFGGGVPHVLVMNAKGEKLGAIGGGGLGLDEYLKKLRGILASKGSKVDGAEARTLFNGGYEKLADWYAQQEAKRPPVSKHVPKGWTEDFEAARQQAAKEGKFVLLAFSGSDWCGPCMALEKEVLSQRKYMGRLTKKYVPVMMSVPRDKSTLSKLAASQNDVLKERYGIRAFPTIVVVNPLDGEEVKRHSGYRSNDSNGYLKQLDGMMKGVKWPAKGLKVKPIVLPKTLPPTSSPEATEGRETVPSAWMTDCGEAQKAARAAGKLMLVYNYPRGLLKNQPFPSDPGFLSYATNRYVLLSVDGWGTEVKSAFPWAFSSGWPSCRILDAEGTLLSPDGNNPKRWTLGHSDYFDATGGQMLALLKGFDKARQVMPEALPQNAKNPTHAELAKLHDALSKLPETFVNYNYLRWAGKLVAADPDGSRGYRACYPYVAKVYPRIKDIIELKRSYSSTLYGQTQKRIRAEGGEQGGMNWSKTVDIITGELAEEWEPKFADAVRRLDEMDSEVPDGDSRFLFDNFKRDVGRILNKLRKAKGTSK